MTTVLPPRTSPAADIQPAALPSPAAGGQSWTITRDWDRLGQPLTVTHVLSGLAVTYAHPWTSMTQARYRISTGQVGAEILAQAVDVLADHTSSDEDRAAAGAAILNLDGISAYCACGGLLHYGIGQVWRHINGCADCLEFPAHCPEGDRARHGYCLQPAPAQCEHGNCRKASTYDGSNGCGCGLRSCGNHDCDTAMPAEDLAALADPLDGATFQIVPTPLVPELHFKRAGVLTDSQWAIAAGEGA